MATLVSGLGGPTGYGEGVFSTATKVAGNNDDGSVFVNISSVFGTDGIDYFGTTYNGIYVNSNGNISFGAANTAYAPALSTTTTPTIAAFWSDVNINNGGNIYWDLDPASGKVTITWLNVRAYSGSTSTNSFQLVLSANGSGDFDVEYIYGDINWTNGGSGVAQTGLTDGGSHDVLLPGSGNATTLAGYESYNFGTSDPNGTTEISFADGARVVADGVVDGTSGNDTIGAGYVDAGNDQIDGTDGLNDVVKGYAGNDSIASGAGNDTVYGGQGNDTIDGGTGNDTIYGDDGGLTDPQVLDWSAQGADGTSLAAGFTQNTGGINVHVGFTNNGNNNPLYQVETTDTTYVAPGEDFDPRSSLYLFGNGDGATSTTTIDFAAASGSGYLDEVDNVSFRINDIDWGSGNHTDIVTVNAYDANGNPVTVHFTIGGGDTLSGNTITANAQANNPGDLAGSVLIEIDGPVAEIRISYSNGQTGTQAIWVSDVHFDAVPDPAQGGDDAISGGDGADILYGEAGNDTLTGGAGADTMYGGLGADTLNVGAGDVASGGAGDDLFILDPTNALGGPGSTITIDGNEDGETDGDTIDFSGLIGWGTINWTGAESGTATLSDGTTVSFSNIENVIICFTHGTGIRTPWGERPVQDLRPGDVVLTRDHGPQTLRWVGRRSVRGSGSLAPVRFARGAFGNDRDLWVSPQHRMVYQGGMATLYFDSPEVMVPAKHLVDGRLITRQEVAEVTYYHLLFDEHQVVWGNGALSESFHPGAEGLAAIDPAAREELFGLFPELRADPNHYGRTARTVLRGYEARLLQPAA